jgi:hypothetical protein
MSLMWQQVVGPEGHPTRVSSVAFRGVTGS